MPKCLNGLFGKNFVTTFVINRKTGIMKEHKKITSKELENDKVDNQEVTKDREVVGHKNKESIHEKNIDEQLEEAKDKYLRLAAEFDNYRKRSAKERLELVSVAAEDTIRGLLPVLDDMERAIKTLRESGADALIIEGEELIFKKLFDYLKSKGLSVVDASGKELDTDFHEAVAQFPVQEKNKKNKIIEILINGYTLNGKVIRFAQVVVGV